MEGLFAVFISKMKEWMDKCIRLREEGCGLLKQSSESEILGRASVQDNPTGQIVSRFEEKKKMTSQMLDISEVIAFSLFRKMLYLPMLFTFFKKYGSSDIDILSNSDSDLFIYSENIFSIYTMPSELP